MTMTDRRIAQLGRQYKEFDQQAKDFVEKKKAVGARLVAEFQRRGRKSSEAVGVKVTLVEPEETAYDWDTLASLLSPSKLRKIQKKEVDKVALAEAVQDGSIDTAIVAQATIVTPKAAYVNVTLPRAS